MSNYQQGTLDIDTINALKELPAWSWSAERALTELPRLRRCLAEHDGVYPKRHAAREEAQLARWMNNPRGDYQQGTFDIDVVNALEGLPAWSWSAERALT